MSKYNSTIHLTVSSSLNQEAKDLAYKQLAIMGNNAWLTVSTDSTSIPDAMVYSYTSELLSELQLYALIPVEIQGYFEVVKQESCTNLTHYLEAQIRVAVMKSLTASGQLKLKQLLTNKHG